MNVQNDRNKIWISSLLAAIPALIAIITGLTITYGDIRELKAQMNASNVRCSEKFTDLSQDIDRVERREGFILERIREFEKVSRIIYYRDIDQKKRDPNSTSP